MFDGALSKEKDFWQRERERKNEGRMIIDTVCYCQSFDKSERRRRRLTKGIPEKKINKRKRKKVSPLSVANVLPTRP